MQILSRSCSIYCLLLSLVMGGTSAADRDERKPYFPPQKVSVLPILHVPKGLAAPDPALARMIYRHVQCTIKSNSAGSYPKVTDYRIVVTTDAGETLGTYIQNAISVRIDASPGPTISFDSRSMWHSDAVDGEAHVDLKFPFPVELSFMRIYSGHSGTYHPVTTAGVLIPDNGGSYRERGRREFQGLDDRVSFDTSESQTWRLALTPGKSRKVTHRGIRFYSDDTEIFGPAICLVKP
ncbi:MAG: hypothetical protein ABGZ53_26055 [Fuerstiella sp.]